MPPPRPHARPRWRPTALLLSTLLTLAGLLLFAKGFFLTRVELPLKSTCSSWGGGEEDAATDACWRADQRQREPLRPYKRVVVVLIDALRLDFVLPHALVEARGANNTGTGLYLNRLVTLRDAPVLYPNRAKVFRLDADPPTTTMQRLKGITTGGLPTFIDIKDDVAVNDRIEEDNLLSQLVAAKRRVTFLGDDTWVKLFRQDAFVRAYPFPSFNVKDLDTVDSGVWGLLHDELEKKDWDVVIAHFLGVDHAGHRYGPAHPEMTRKLMQMDDIVESVMRFVDKNPDVLLVVMGDHGMTQEGNHGGASDEERSAALFVYSARDLPGFSKEAHPELDENVVDGVPTVEQIDLAPTLSFLMGLPAPFGNLGMVVPHLLFHSGWMPSSGGSHAHVLVSAAVANVKQVLRYLDTYATANGGSAGVPLAKRQALRRDFDEAVRLFETGAVKAEEAYRRIRAAGRAAAREARALWVQFDLIAMGVGCLLTVGGALVVVRETGGFSTLGVGVGVATALGLLALLSNSFIVAEPLVVAFGVSSALVGDGRRRALAGQSSLLKVVGGVLAARLVPSAGEVMRTAGHEPRPSDWATQCGVVLMAAWAAWAAWSAVTVLTSGGREFPAHALSAAQAAFVAGFWGWLPHVDALPRAVFATGLAAFAATRGTEPRVLFVPFALVLGPASPNALVLVLLAWQAGLVAYDPQTEALSSGLFAALVVLACFSATGHACDFGSLRITAPYVGFDEFGYWRGVVMLTADTFGAHILGSLVLAQRPSLQSLFGFVSVFAARAAVTTCFVAAQRRHLMVWAIFAPKFVFDACAFATVSVTALVAVYFARGGGAASVLVKS